MALSLPSLDIINPQYTNDFLLDETIPEIFDFSFEEHPPQDLSPLFQAEDCRSLRPSLISFDQVNQFVLPSYNSGHEKINECNAWPGTLDQNYNNVHNYPLIGENMYVHEESQYVVSYPVTSHIDYVQEILKQEAGVSQKRKFEGVDMQKSKKKCETNRKTKASTSPSKDSQSLAAKNRRERISERLKVLQELVPNGTKVDLVTMLEKAISYVKFLQLQVKVLSTDEFWPAQGGKTPDISQVKEAIDAILLSAKVANNSKVENKQNIINEK